MLDAWDLVSAEGSNVVEKQDLPRRYDHMRVDHALSFLEDATGVRNLEVEAVLSDGELLKLGAGLLHVLTLVTSLSICHLTGKNVHLLRERERGVRILS